MGEKKAVIKVSVPFVSADIAGSPSVCIRGDHAARMRYLKAIAVEAESVAGDFGGSVIEAIAIDGPMPSVMSPDGLGAFLRSLGRFFNVRPDCESSIVAAPHTVGTPTLTGWGLGKIRRVVLRAESLQASELQAIGAPYGPADIQNALLFLDRFGVRNVDAILTVGIPGQTEASLLRSVRSLAGVGVSHVTLRPFAAGNPPADRDCMRRLFDVACERLATLGYGQWLPGRFSRSDAPGSAFAAAVAQGADVVGIGLGATTLCGGAAYRTTDDFERYTTAPDNPEAIVAAAVRFDDAASRVLAMARSLMRSDAHQGGIGCCAGDEGFTPAAPPASMRGLAEFSAGAWHFTEDGRFAWFNGDEPFSVAAECFSAG